MFKRSTQRINKVISQFEKVKIDLQTGICEVDEDINCNAEEITRLQSETTILANTRKRAQKIVDQISKIIDL